MSVDTSFGRDWSLPGQGLRYSSQLPDSGRLVSYSVPAPELSVDIFLRQAEGKSRFFWQKRGDEPLYAGFGTAVQLMAWGENRFIEIQTKAASLFEDAQVLGLQASPVLPRFFGGFSFRDDFTPDNTWAAFYPAHFVLPHFQFVQEGASKWLTINALVGENEDLPAVRLQLQEALQARYRFLLNVSPEADQSSVDENLEIAFPLSYQAWAEQVNSALKTMNTSALKKVVLARVCEVKSKSRLNISRALTFLNNSYQECTRFLFEPRPNHAFYGATPELLVKVEGAYVSTMAMAGSISRGKTDVEDLVKAQELLDSAKDRHEHKLVVDAIRRRLEPITSELDIPHTPEVFRLSYINHLLTPIKGKLHQKTGVLPLVELLHPTPALGGSPRDRAIEFISRAEPVPRGWYAGPVGWLDNRMDGEFVVAIRSAVAQERRLWAYAGAGIVPESIPEIEWVETDLKFQPMLKAIGAKVFVSSRSDSSPLGIQHDR